jgi:N-glycosylase/DNA lyase
LEIKLEKTNIIKKTYKIKVKNFNLKYTIESGQFFYFEKINDYYYIIERDKIFKIKQEGDFLYTYFNKNCSINYIINFLNIKDENSYEKIIKNEKDKLLKEGMKKYYGLRIIKQDPFQCSISFICSSAANIEKIKKNVKLISKFFGEKEIFDNIEFYHFPSPEKINDLNKLIDAKTGYRAKYILEFSKKIKRFGENYLEKLKNETHENCRITLKEFNGIGTKIADCISLFALNKKESFPIDTQIKKIMINNYMKNEKEIKKIKESEILKIAKDLFKENLGLKQQFLYLYMIDKNKK